jgi:hypothetical protein
MLDDFSSTDAGITPTRLAVGCGGVALTGPLPVGGGGLRMSVGA